MKKSFDVKGGKNWDNPRVGQREELAGDSGGEAERKIRLSLSQEPKNYRAYNDLAVLLHSQNKIDLALNCLYQALALKPDYTDAALNCGEILKVNGKAEERNTFLRKYLAINSMDAYVRDSLIVSEEKEMRDLLRKSLVCPGRASTDTYRITAIVSLYKAERFLRGCLDDLLKQTLGQKIEIILIDANSPQAEGQIAEEYQRHHSNITYIRTPTRIGIYAAWNIGVMVAHGAYLTNANADDRHVGDTLERMAALLDERKDIALVYGDFAATRKENDTVLSLDLVRIILPEFNRIELFQQCFVGPQPLWRKSLHQKYGYFDQYLKSAGDYEFWLRISKDEVFQHIKDMLGVYLLSESGMEMSDKTLSIYESELCRARYLGNLLV